jgi:hypothetical protein
MPYSNAVDVPAGNITVDKTPLIDKVKGNHWETAVIDWAWRNFFSDKGQGLYSTLVYPISGDFNRIAANGKAWKYTAESLDKIQRNLDENKGKLRKTGWQDGPAAQAFDDTISMIWTPALLIASKSCDYLAKGFDKLAELSVKVAEKVVDLLDKVVDRIVSLAKKLVPGLGQVVSVFEWIASGFEKFPYWDDVKNIGKMIDEVFTLHKKITSLVSAAKGYLAGANQIVDAIKLIPEIDSVGDAAQIGKNVHKGAEEMKKKKESFDKAKTGVEEQRSKMDVILNGDSKVDQNHLPG